MYIGSFINGKKTHVSSAIFKSNERPLRTYIEVNNSRSTERNESGTFVI